MTDHRKEYEEGRLSTTSGRVPKNFDSPAPDLETKANGQHKDYWVLSETERAKGFVRPVRSSYVHVGIPGPKHPLRDLTSEEQKQTEGFDYAKFEDYLDGGGRYWRQVDLDRIGKGCGVVTSMGRALAETYAREPGFYGSTMCVNCSTHLPVGQDGEFVWSGTDERVGT